MSPARRSIGARPSRWTALLDLAQLASVVVLGGAAGLVFWAVAPLVLGWSANAVLTGSMAPQVAVGDVLAADPVRADVLHRGMVVLFHDPEDPGHVLAHRIASVTADGELVTRGDANAVPDATPVPLANVVGVARLRVPWVGLPRVWLHQGRFGPLLAAVLVVAGTATLATWPSRPDPTAPGAGTTGTLSLAPVPSID